ncbi:MULTISPECIES: RagB/SusD family nutrient uptake outer membrane protein [Chitinophagaceae]
MKHQLIKVVSAAILLLVGTGCAKFIDKKPLDKFSDLDYWNSEDNLRAYAYDFYSIFTGFGTGTSGDFYFSSFTDDQDAATLQKFALTVPASDGTWSNAYANIRKANIMLERIPAMNISDEAKNHWNGIAKFFRAYNYFNLVKRFGDAPWINHSIDVSETSVLYKPRDPRNMVMDSVLNDINYAVTNIRASDGVNVVNKDVALALKSRICLYEGTFRKYHTEANASNADQYLQQSMEASKQLMSSSYALDANYQTVYNSLDLSGDKEVIMFKQYAPGFLTHSVIGYTNSSTTMSGLTKSAVDAYVCTDGLPISVSSLYAGDDTLPNTRKNRDGRLLQTISDFLCYQGNLVGGFSSSTGYRPSKFLQPNDPNQLAPYNSTDAPLFWLPEMLLNYAEAAAELDDLGKYTMTQSDLDLTVNKLRGRVGVAALTLVGHQRVAASGISFVDPKKDADVPSLIWEIRRERRVELMMDGFRFDDLMRWKKGDYMDNSKNPDIFLGAKVKDNGVTKRNADGYILPYAAGTARPFVDPKNYLSPIPSGQISLYQAQNVTFTQNPGWE